MKLPLRLIILTSILALLSAPVFAQAPRGRLLVTVVDTTNAVIPNTRVTVTALDDAAKAAAIAPVQTSPDGVAIVDRLAPGRYSILAEFG